MSEKYYIEDYFSDEMIKKVENAVKPIIDDEDFLISVFSAIDNDEEANKVIRYIESHPNTTPRDIIIVLSRIMQSKPK